MVPIMHRISAQLKEVTGEMAKEKQVVQLKRLFSDLSFEVIMSTGFGIEVNAWRDKENIVKKMARTYLGLEGGYGLAMKLMVVITMPWIAQKLKLRVFNAKAEDFLGKELALIKGPAHTKILGPPFEMFFCISS